MGASVIASVNTSPILELSKHVLDFMALPVEAAVVWYLDLSVGFRGDAGLNSTVGESDAKPISVISLVAQKLFGVWNCWQHQRRPLEVAHLPFAQQHDQRTTKPVANGVQFGVQSSFGPPNTARKSPFFCRLAAVR